MKKRSSKKNNNLTFLALLSLMLVMVCAVVVSNTYAKYTSSVTGSDSATVALWSWEINDVALTAGTNTFTFNLFDTIKDTGGTAAETDVASGKIAPGTSGSFAIKLENLSEVNAKYAINFEVTGIDGANIQFSTDPTFATAGTTIDGTDIAMKDTATPTIYWRWAYETGADAEAIATSDAAETALGFEGTAEATVKATVTLTQVD